MLNGQQIGNSCSSTRERKTGYFGNVEVQAEESFRKSEVRKAVTTREFESSGELTKRSEVAHLVEAGLKARGSVWPVLLTFRGSLSLRGSLCVMGRSQVTERQELVALQGAGLSGNGLGLQCCFCWLLVGS